MGFISDIGGALTGSTAADAATKASRQQMAGIGQAERYLGDYYDPIQQNQLQARDMLSNYFMGGGDEMYRQAQASPQYSYLQNAGEQGVLRGASATGGLRSGNANQALAQSNQGVLQGLVDQQLQGLQYFNNQDAGQGTLADLMMQKAGVQAQGTTAAGQARQAGMGNMMNLAMGAGQFMGGMGGGMGGAAGGGMANPNFVSNNSGANSPFTPINWGI